MSGISFDTFDAEDVGGFDSVQPGSYHCQVVKVVPEDDKGKLAVSFEVLRGTTPGQSGKVHIERFSADLKAGKSGVAISQKKRAAIAFATKVVTIEQAKLAKAEGREIIPDWESMNGRQVCLNLVKSEDGKYTNLNWDEVWAPEDKKAQHVPLHQGMLTHAGIILPADRSIDGVTAHTSKGAAKPAGNGAAAASPAAADAGSILKGVV